jgi:hypothetical protein
MGFLKNPSFKKKKNPSFKRKKKSAAQVTLTPLSPRPVMLGLTIFFGAIKAGGVPLRK